MRCFLSIIRRIDDLKNVEHKNVYIFSILLLKFIISYLFFEILLFSSNEYTTVNEFEIESGSIFLKICL